MLDIRFIRENKDLMLEMLKQRGADLEIGPVLALDERRRQIIQEVESL